MKNRAMLFAISLFTLNALFAVQPKDVSLKLINRHTGFVVVEFKNGTPQFHDRFLEAEMIEKGIAIPAYRRTDFMGKNAVYLDDPQFQEAFTEIYIPLTIASDHYQWQD